MYSRALVLGTAVAAVLVSSAASATTEPPTTAPANATFTVQHAENFTLTYDDDYKVLTIGAGNTAETFVLVQRGAETPVLDGELAGAVHHVTRAPQTLRNGGRGKRPATAQRR